MKDETIQRLLQLWKSVEEERPYIKFPNWDKRRKPSKRELPRLSIRTWNNAPNWYGMINIYETLSWLMNRLRYTNTLSPRLIRIDILIMEWKLGDYLKALRDAEARYFIERLRRLALAIVDAIDEKDAET